MNLAEFHTEIAKLLYIEDKNMVNVVLASIVANSMRIGDPVWLTLIGPSSGGKSQLIRPFAIAKPDLIHRLDDLTANTLLSGTLGLEGSLLGRIGTHGVLSMDDLTVLFSKSSEERAAILSQFRMLYDGQFSKSSGNRKEDIVWNGYMGMIAGSTPSIYRYFAEVADMGERFVSYRMKPFNVKNAVEFIGKNNVTSGRLNEALSDIVREYVPALLQGLPQDQRFWPKLHDSEIAMIEEVSQHMTLLRTPVHTDERTGLVDEFPEPEMPFRVMKQLSYLATAMHCLQDDINAPLSEEMLTAIRWTAYSLANDKRRAYVRAVAGLDAVSKRITARNVSAVCGLHSDVVAKGLSQLQAIGIISLKGDEGGTREWIISNRSLIKLVIQIDDINNQNYAEATE